MRTSEYGAERSRRVLIIGTDGMRPDAADPELMPTYAKLRSGGTLFSEYYAAYPPHTRVSMTTLTTGVYPGRHGVINNLMYIPGFHADGLLQTGNDKHLLEFEPLQGEPVILAQTLGDRLNKRGKRLSVAASSSPGASLLWNINHPYLVVNLSSDYGQSELAELHKKLGPVPEERGSGKSERAKWATRALIEEQLGDPDNQVMALWLSEPDSSQHDYGLGSPEAKEALRTVDRCVAEVLDAVERLGLSDQIDLLWISDHGHSTVQAEGTLKDHVENACRELGLRSPFIVADNNIFSDPEMKANIAEVAQLVEWLRNQEWCGMIFSGDAEVAKLSGVMSIDVIMGPVNHRRAPLLSVSPVWSEELNEYGVPGITRTLISSEKLKSNHGCLSPFDLHAFCLGYGPSFTEGEISDIPCGLVDIAPTVCGIIGLADETGFDGHSLIAERTVNERTRIVPAGESEEAGIHIAVVNGTRYVLGSF